jgi:transposase InsO family protein
LQAAFAREVSPAERASARRGEAGRREHGLYLRYEAPHRNAVWQADHKQLPVLVVPPGRQRGRRPWVTLFLDDFSRAVVGWAISLQPTSAEVLAALRDAILVDPDRGPFGGVPGRLRWDHGLEFAATAVEQAALALGIDVDPATPYAPHEKGKVERLHRTITDCFVAGLPCWTGGPRDHRGQLEAPGAPLALGEFVTRFDAWVRATPAGTSKRRWRRWAGDEASLRRVSDAVHDAYIDGLIEHDRAAGVVAVPFLQEGFAEGPPREQVRTGETWRYREYRVTFFRGRLVIRRVRAVQEPDGWDDELMIYSAEFDPQMNQVRVCSGECLRVTVDALDVHVEVSGEPGGHVRRRVGKFTGIVSDKWLDQQRRASRSTRLPL